ncbi:aminotransferase [Vibrio cholerae]|uniref:DegT/DnrJ/EryC1/StrS family aminotransferase n=1 Tax=Vibrio cholerae TaxID=666 RepID=UPI0011D5A1FF|nr:DegT/DnrJ/EryC1/StrS family aminotransferase [Vibrio cholerae]MBA8612778.1 DegT/DnrJ/EryC1/StrS family aminotransferase [Vibrio cholerae]TYA77444.1 DegT/DnrJ/EryC1/StrS family aminotransferase [Vibrio cholerae]BCN18888.1 putative aminotransferase [Vibrio cholerae]BCN20590.1 putative aminotransferase [Vibrio cholerae]GHZ64996.1 aminotransferase [Vibrio cholerae]
MNKIRLSKSSISEKEKLSVAEVLTQEYLGMGQFTRDFEVAIANYLEISANQVATVNTGTSALHIALSAIDIRPGDEVLVPSLTYVASFQVISALGATPIACEVLPNTLFLDPMDVRSKITPKSKAIMPVHYASSCKGIEDIFAIATEFNLRVVEDAAQAFGSEYKGKKVGSFGDIICFSFDGIKNITCGEGGAVISSDLTVIEKVRDARLLGVIKDTEKRYLGLRSWDFDVVEQGFRYHLSNINAAIGTAQLSRIDEFKDRRRQIAKKYVDEFFSLKRIHTLDFSFDEVMPHIFVIKSPDRNVLREYLLEKNIEVGIHYKPNHKLTKYKCDIELPVTDLIYEQILTLPCHFDLTNEEQEYVIKSIRDFYEQ